MTKVIAVYDYGNSVADRYTIVYDEYRVDYVNGKPERLYMALSMGNEPWMPNGVCMSSEVVLGNHLGKKITLNDLPKRVLEYYKKIRERDKQICGDLECRKERKTKRKVKK